MNQATPIPTVLDFPDNDRLAREITLLAGQINAANYRLLKLIAAFDSAKGWSGGGTVRSCAHWLNWQCGIALGAAREKVRVAHCLESLPLIDAAFASGEISYSKVRAMTRVATPENEDYLLMIARHGTANHIEQAVGKYRSVRRGLDADTEKQQLNARELVYFQDDNGQWIIHARLAAEAGDLVIKAIEAAVELERTDPTANVSAETPDNGEPPAAGFVEEQRPTYGQSRADALEQVAEHFLASGQHPAALKGSERCQVQLHVSLSALQGANRPRRADSPANFHCHLEHNQGISPDTARRLCCDASLVTVLEDENGNVLNIGRRSRTVPPAIRRALAVRDGGCRVPGCCETRYVDAHHVVHWADGGETSLDNLVTLCRHHHRALHRGEFTVTRSGREFIFRNPRGAVLQSSIYPQFRDVSAETLPRKLSLLAPHVSATTCLPHWEGEDCDYSMVIDGLLRRDGVPL